MVSLNMNNNVLHPPQTLAERKAWELNKAQDVWDLVTINPSFVLGPPQVGLGW